jgi:hypothetical protein
VEGVPPELAASRKFEVVGKLGEGGMGAVYQARHTFLGEMVAIKVMSGDALGHPEARARFLGEMRAAGRLNHPNIVRALDADTLALSAHLDEVVPLGLADAVKMPLKPGEWFPLEVIAEGNRLRVLVNGNTVVDHTDANETFAAGRLGLVCRGGAVVKFRKMEIKELAPGKLAGNR